MLSPDTEKVDRVVSDNKSTSSGLDWLMRSVVIESVYTVVNLPQKKIDTKTVIGELLTSKYPLIEIAEFSAGPRAVVRGTRIAVSTIIGYLLAGETLETIQKEVLTSLRPAQLYDAIQYYADHKDEIRKELEANQETQVRSRLPKFG